jgi:uncharacterized protein (TIGR02246 family)
MGLFNRILSPSRYMEFASAPKGRSRLKKRPTRMKRFALALALTVAGAALVGCGEAKHDAPHAVARITDAMATEAEIAALFDRWNETLQTGDPHDVALLYAEDGVLLPTVSNKPRTNRAEMADYFEHFQQLQPKGAINEQHIDILDENSAINSGIYTFDLVRDGAPTQVTARYSYVYEKVNGKWLIKSHHSSAMPEPMDGPLPTLAARRAHRIDAGFKPTTHEASYSPDDAYKAAGNEHGDDHGKGHAAKPEKAHAPAKDHGH